MREFGETYQQQYAVALFNSVRYEIEGGGTQSQLLHRKASAPAPPCSYSDLIHPLFSQEDPDGHKISSSRESGSRRQHKSFDIEKKLFHIKTISNDSTHTIHKSLNTA